MRLKDLTGKTFGKLIVIERGPTKCTRVTWLCKCECGRTIHAFGNNLIRGTTQTCGNWETCRLGQSHPYHGAEDSPAYNTWRSMIKRCYDPKHENYPYYGGRGITVCERWRSGFKHFLEDMGERPERHVIDRIDFNGNYEPGNCRWVTHKESVANRRTPVRPYPAWLHTPEAVSNRVASMLRNRGE